MLGKGSYLIHCQAPRPSPRRTWDFGLRCSFLLGALTLLLPGGTAAPMTINEAMRAFPMSKRSGLGVGPFALFDGERHLAPGNAFRMFPSQDEGGRFRFKDSKRPIRVHDTEGEQLFRSYPELAASLPAELAANDRFVEELRELIPLILEQRGVPISRLQGNNDWLYSGLQQQQQQQRGGNSREDSPVSLAKKMDSTRATRILSPNEQLIKVRPLREENRQYLLWRKITGKK